MTMDMDEDLLVPRAELMAAYLHIGVEADVTHAQIAQVAGCQVAMVSSEGDDWDEWGEEPRGPLRHTIIALDAGASVLAAQEWVAALWRAGLLRVGFGGEVPYIAVLGDPAVWEYDFMMWRAPCEDCGRFVMDELQCPNAHSVCVDCCGEDEH